MLLRSKLKEDQNLKINSLPLAFKIYISKMTKIQIIKFTNCKKIIQNKVFKKYKKLNIQILTKI